jgi:AraC family transcriptional regulator
LDVEIKQMPAFRVGTVGHSGAYNEIGKAFERLGAIAGPAGLFEQPGAIMIGIYYDDPDTTPQDQLRSDAAIVVPEQMKLPEGLVEKRIPKGRFARTEHVGSYEGLSDAWARLKEQTFRENGHRIGARPSYEIYRNTPMTVPKEELRTEIYLPIG